VSERPPVPITPGAAAARRRYIARLRAEIAAGTYRVPAEAVAAALLEHARLLRESRRPPSG
jgi:anti-sigma28 factor (negative regulator of flagellin synthesis)